MQQVACKLNIVLVFVLAYQNSRDFFGGELAHFKVYVVREFLQDEITQSEDDEGATMDSHRWLNVVESTNKIAESEST